MRIGIMSDSHRNHRAIERAVERVAEVSKAEGKESPSLWLHAGDNAEDATYLGLLTDVQIENVAGNTDWPDGKTPYDHVVEVLGHRIFLTHGHMYGVKATRAMLSRTAEEVGADIAIYGHTHVLSIEVEETDTGEVLILNPGSVSEPRDGKPPVCMVLEINEGENRELSNELKEEVNEKKLRIKENNNKIDVKRVKISDQLKVEIIYLN